MMALFSEIPLEDESRTKINTLVNVILYIGVAIICVGLGVSYWRIKKLKLDQRFVGRPNELLNDNERSYLLEVIKTRIKYIIADTEILLNNGGQLQIVEALYIHAIEEYGKYLYVKDLQSVAGIVEIEMKNKFLDHKYKIKSALKQLPKECTSLEGDLPDWETRLTILNTDIKDGKALHLPKVEHEDLKKAIEKFKSVLQNLN